MEEVVRRAVAEHAIAPRDAGGPEATPLIQLLKVKTRVEQIGGKC
jgi:hypothetical protein